MGLLNPIDVRSRMRSQKKQSQRTNEKDEEIL